MAASSQGDMPKKLTVFSYQETFQRGDALIVLLRRDAADLAARGVTTARIDALEDLIEGAKVRPAADYYEMVVSEAIAEKNGFRDEVKFVVEELRGMVENVYGASSDKYGEFGFVNLLKLADFDFLGVIRGKLIPALVRYAAELAPEGYTGAMLTDLQAKVAALDAAFESVGTARGDGVEATRARINEANDIWEQVTDLANTGQTYYRRRNAGKYAEYSAITRRSATPGTTPDIPTDAEYDVLTGELSWADSATETSYTVEITENGVATEHDLPENTTSFAIEMGATVKSARVRARNAAGVSAWSPSVSIPAAAQPGMPYNLQYIPESNGNPGVTTADAPAGATALRMFYQADGHPKNEVGVMTNGAYSWTLWLIPGTIFVQAEFPGGVVSAQATLRVE